MGLVVDRAYLPHFEEAAVAEAGEEVAAAEVGVVVEEVLVTNINIKLNRFLYSY